MSIGIAMQDVHSYIMSHGPSFSVLHPFISGVFRIIGGVNFHEFSDDHFSRQSDDHRTLTLTPP